MKKLIIVLLFAMCSSMGVAQTTVTIYTNPQNSSSALINNYYPNTALGFTDDLHAIAWTSSSVVFTTRGLLRIDLSSIPANAVIQSATLSLYSNTTSSNQQLHSSLSGSNAGFLRRITQPWNANAVSWGNQPSVSTQNQVIIPQSTSSTQDYPNIDVSNLIQDIVSSGNNYGFILRLQTESHYRSLIFASNHHSDTTKRPRLSITYTLPFSILTSGNSVSCYGQCNGGATINVVSGSPPFTYLWSTSDTTQTIQNLCPGTYTVTVSGSQGSLVDSFTVTQPPKLMVNGSGPHSICPGQSVTLSAAATGGTPPLFYYWSHNLGMGSSKTVSPTITTDYFVHALDLNGCNSDPDTISVVVQAAQQAVIYGLSTTYCTNDTAVSLTAFPAGGSFAGNGVSGSSFSPSQAGPGVHTITYSVSVGCVAPAQMQVSVYSAPVVSLSGLSPTFCTQTAAVTLSGSPAGGSFSGNGINAGVFSPLNAGPGLHSITYTFTDTNGCSATSSQNTTVAQSPTANAGVDLLIQFMTSATLMGTASGGSNMYSYAWAPPDSFYFPNVQAPTTKPLTVTNTFTLTVTDLASSCQASDQMVVNVINSTALMVVASANPTVACSGTPVQLSALASGGIGNYTYSWSSLPAGFSSTLANPIANPLYSTTYTVSVSDGSNFTSASTSVSVHPPVLCYIAGLPAQLCTNSLPLTLQGNPSGGLFSGTAVAAGVFYPALAGTGVHKIYYQYTNTNGCSGIDSASIAVLPPPVVSLSGIPMSVCNSDAPYTLVGNPAGGTFTGTGVNGNLFNPAGLSVGSHLLSYHYTDTATQCFSSASISITVKPAPTANAGSDQTIACGGSGVQIGSSPLPTLNYFWSPSAGLSNPLISNPVANPAYTTVYILQVTDTQSQCSSYDTVVVFVMGGPTVSVSADTMICAGSSISLMAGGASHFLWSTGDTNAVIWVQPLQTTSYVVQVYNDTLCKGIDSILVEVVQPKLVSLGNDTAISIGSSIVLDAGGGFVSYLWSTGSTQQSILVDGFVIGWGVHNLWVTVLDSNGCSSSDTLVLAVVTGIPSMTDETIIRVYPNPFEEEVWVELGEGANHGTSGVFLYDAAGRKVIVSVFKEGGRIRLYAPALPDGAYILEVFNGISTPSRTLLLKQKPR